MSLETVTLDHLPSSYKIHLALFRDVQNSEFLHQQLLARNSDFEYAFVDASVVLSRLQLLSAVFKATSAAAASTLRTANVHSEVIYSMSSSNNISEAYRRYGISPATKDLVVVKITFPTEDGKQVQSHDEIWEHLKTNVQGEPLSITDEQIATTADIAKVRKYYKLNSLRWLDDIKNDELQKKEMESLIVSAIALRGV